MNIENRFLPVDEIRAKLMIYGKNKMPDNFGRFIVGIKEQIIERWVNNMKREMTWDSFQDFIKEYMQKGTQYRAGAIFQAYLEEHCIHDCREDKFRKSFEMFLRSQTLEEDGFLKRSAHGVYEIRTDPNDRGVSFPRTVSSKQKVSTMTDILSLYRRPRKKDYSLEEILENCLDLAANIKTVFHQLGNQDEMPNECHIELAKIEERLLESVDRAITELSVAMAWSEDYTEEEIQSETERMNMGGM
ncbi:MAG: hypothetical protein IKK03_13095 [Lachnospiraceae bacterium]|nr:hypothetical protein [Lachnospiraceae bacterium]